MSRKEFESKVIIKGEPSTMVYHSIYQGERENEETDVLDVTEPKTNEEPMFLVHGITHDNP